MPELDDVLVKTLDDGGRALAGTRLDDDTSAVLRGRIAARRARRRVIRSVVAVPAAAALVIGGVAVWQHLGPDPKTPVATNPVPGPTTEPGPDATTAPEDLVPLPAQTGLPARYEAPPGILASAEPGWVLSTYTPDASYDEHLVVPTETFVLLTDPAGTTYQLLTLDPTEGVPGGTDWVSSQVVDWQAGDTTALVARKGVTWLSGYPGYSSPTYARLDLTTGALAALDPVTTGLWFVGHGVDADGGDVTVWLKDGFESEAEGDRPAVVVQGAAGTVSTSFLDSAYSASLAPDGRSVLAGNTVLAIEGGSTGARDLGTVDAGAGCEALTWWTADSLLLRCADPDPQGTAETWLARNPRLAVAKLGSLDAPTTLRNLAAGDALLYRSGGGWVADERVVVGGEPLTASTSVYGEGCSLGAYWVAGPDAAVTPFPAADQREGIGIVHVARAGSTVAVSTTYGGCGDSVGTSVVTGVDLATGAATVLLPEPEGSEANPWMPAPTSWVLGR
jgi:hypothetical protein